MRNKIIIFIIIVLSIILMPKVKASEMIFGSNGSIRIYNGNSNYIYVNQSYNSLPSSTEFSANSTINWGVIDLSLSPASGNINVLDNSFNYLIFDFCSTSNLNIIISNSSCNGSCLSSGSYSSVSTGQSCTTHGYNGTRRLVQVRIQKWYLNEVAEMLEAQSYINVSNGTYYNFVTFNQVFLSNEDFTIVYANQQTLIDKLNSVQTSITNMQNSINTNANTNTQNIINNQNTNATQAHNDSVNTQNTIKDDSIDNPNSSINIIKNSLATNGVITSLVVLPVTLYQSILNSVNGTCSSFSLGSLYGTNLTIPCINVANYVGVTLWGSIDVIISGIFVYMISRKMVKVFNQLSSLKEGDILDG